MDLDANILGAFDFEKTGSHIAIKRNFRVGIIVADNEIVFLGKSHPIFKNRFIRDDGSCRVIRIIQEKHLGPPGN